MLKIYILKGNNKKPFKIIGFSQYSTSTCISIDPVNEIMQSQVLICMHKMICMQTPLLYESDFLRSRIQSNFQLTFS